MFKPILSTALAVALCSTANAATILQTWAGPINVSGGGNGTLLVNTTSDTGDWITAGSYNAGTAAIALYFLFTMNVSNNAGETGAGGFFTAFQLAAGTPNSAANERLAVGNFWTSTVWGGFQGTGDYNLTGSPAITLSQPENLVLKIDQQANTATIWFNPNMNVLEANQPAGITTSLGGLGNEDTFDAIWLRAGNGTGSTTFTDMAVHDGSPFVPEPSTAVLFSLGLLGLFGRRRTRAIRGN